MSYIGHITPLLDNITNQILFGDTDGTVDQDPKFLVNPTTGQLFFAGYDGTLTGAGTSYAMFTNSGAVVQDTGLITGTDLFDFEDNGVPSSFTVQAGDTVSLASADSSVNIDASVPGTIDFSVIDHLVFSDDQGVPNTFNAAMGSTVIVASADNSIGIDASVAGTIDLTACSFTCTATTQELGELRTEYYPECPLPTGAVYCHPVLANLFIDLTAVGNITLSLTGITVNGVAYTTNIPIWDERREAVFPSTDEQIAEFITEACLQQEIGFESVKIEHAVTAYTPGVSVNIDLEIYFKNATVCPLDDYTYTASEEGGPSPSGTLGMQAGTALGYTGATGTEFIFANMWDHLVQQVGKNVHWKERAITDAEYYLDWSEEGVLVLDATGGVVNVNLPVPANLHNATFDYAPIVKFRVKNIDNAVTLTTPTGLIIDDGAGGLTYTFAEVGELLSVQSDGTNWNVVDKWLPSAGAALLNIVEDTSPQLGGDLDANGSDILNVPMMDFDTAAGITVTQGQLAWNADEETLDLGQNGAILQIGQEIHYHVRNITGVQIDDGTPVMSTGTIGGSSRITVAPMNNDGSIESFYFMGIATEDIADSSDGKVTHFGKIRGIQTDGVNYGEAWIDGDLIYLDPAAAGDLTKTKPTQNSHKDPIAIVIDSHASNGTLFVRASSGHGIQHASDVYEQSVTAGELLVRDATNSWWENQTLAEAGILGNVVEDTTPQLGGDLDMNGNQITSPDGTDLIDIPDGSIDLQTNSLSRLDITDAGVRLGAANARVTTVLDEDNMASDSATALATQQSIKAYIDGFGYIANLSEDATPQLGGVLDVNGNRLGSPDGTDGVDIINGSLDVQTNSLSRLDVTDSGVRLGAANARVTTILDEDAMGSDSDTSLATQQSIKAYIDNSLGARPVMKSYTFSSTAGSGEFYLAGYYDAPLADANLSQASTTQTLGNANVPYAAHAFLVAGGAGTASGGAGAVIITVTGTSITDAGVRTPADSQTIVADITTMGLNDYYETSKKWIGQVTYTLDVGATGHTAYAADFNYGWCKYEDFGNRDFTITDVEAVGLAGANDTSFNIDLLLHSDAGWTYSAAAFSPGGTSIEDMNSDHVTEIDLDNGEPFAWKRAALAQAVSGSASEGVVVKITTGAAGAVEYMDLHLGVTI